MEQLIRFDSDYMEGAHPEVMRRLVETNLEHTVGYGCDEYSSRARQLIREACEAPEALVHFLVGGTQTNDTVIDAMLRGYEGVMAAGSGHICVHEAGAIEHSGRKVLVVPDRGGKVEAQAVEQYLSEFYADETYEHMVQPGMLYISQPTEVGGIYSKAELTALSNVCHKNGIKLYVDGARMAYALAADENDVTLADLARLADAFYIGGTKCGLLMGEAVVVPNPALLPHFFTHIKQHGALLAKGRLLGVQFETLFTDGLYVNIARHAVDLALKLKLAFISHGYRVAFDSPTNQQFFTLPNDVVDRLAQHATFVVWGSRGETETTIRLVTSWATTEEDVDKLISLL